MGLDVELIDADGEIIFSANITHNLTAMADAAGIYDAVWRPGEVGITKAGQLVNPLEAGLTQMQAEPARFEQFNAANGWGKLRQFVPWLQDYLNACRKHPEATASAER